MDLKQMNDRLYNDLGVNALLPALTSLEAKRIEVGLWVR